MVEQTPKILASEEKATTTTTTAKYVPPSSVEVWPKSKTDPRSSAVMIRSKVELGNPPK